MKIIIIRFDGHSGFDRSVVVLKGAEGGSELFGASHVALPFALYGQARNTSFIMSFLSAREMMEFPLLSVAVETMSSGASSGCIPSSSE